MRGYVVRSVEMNSYLFEMENREKICKFCCAKCDSNFKIIDRSTHQNLNVLLISMDLATNDEPVMCKNCEEMLIKCFDFKTKCLYSQNHIASHLNSKDNVELDLKHVYVKENVTATGVPKNQDLCRLCLGFAENCSSVSLDVEKGDVMLKKMIEQCLPELDLSVIKNHVICASCHGSLVDCFHFVVNYLIVAEKSNKYCETADRHSDREIELGSSLQFAIRNITRREVNGNLADTIKVEQFCEDRKNPDEGEIDNGQGTVVKSEQILLDDSEDANNDIENKNKCFMKMNDQEVNSEQYCTPTDMLASGGKSNELDFIKIEEIFYEENDTKHENLVETKDRKSLLNEEAEIRSVEHNINRFEDVIIVARSEQPSRLQTKAKCSMPSFENDHLNEANYENGLTRHLLKHKDSFEVPMYKCDSCLYQTKHKAYLKRHSLVHKNPSEVELFKCGQCSFQTKHKGALKTHMSTHKDLSEVALYKCDFCSFQTKHKYDHKVHLQGHKDASNEYVYKCDSCLYQTKVKGRLKRHSLIHKDPSELPMYKCDYCSHQTKMKSSLKRHLLTHMDPTEVTMYKCDYCSLQTKHGGAFKSHLLIHKNPSEIIMYKCDSCPYQTKRKLNLKNHMLTHKDPTETTIYKCDTCFFQTKYENNINKHLLTHKDPSEVTMHQCNSCSFQTKHKRYLKIHLLSHKDPSEITMHKCYFCSYQTRNKYNLKSHLQSHKDPTEVTIYKCDGCSFKTKSKSYLKKHIVSLMAKAHGSDLVNFTGDVKNI